MESLNWRCVDKMFNSLSRTCLQIYWRREILGILATVMYIFETTELKLLRTEFQVSSANPNRLLHPHLLLNTRRILDFDLCRINITIIHVFPNCSQQPANRLSVFDHFVGLALKVLVVRFNFEHTFQSFFSSSVSNVDFEEVNVSWDGDYYLPSQSKFYFLYIFSSF